MDRACYMYNKLYSVFECLQGRHYLEDMGLDGRILIKLISRKRARSCIYDTGGSGKTPVMGSWVKGFCKLCNEPMVP